MYWIFLCLMLIACTSSDKPTTAFPWVTIAGREEPRTPLYRAQVAPVLRLKPELQVLSLKPELQNLKDTTIPLAEFTIEDVKVTVHNFPSDRLEDRIPPAAQIARWKQQFDEILPSNTQISPAAHGGFSGLYFQGTGISHGLPHAVLGWSMQIAPEHYQNLHDQRYRQMRSDYTIKAVGPPDQIQKHRKEIEQFANTFELIEEIPS